jgi:uncharacterized iron-regulated membrane protein
MKDGFRQAMAWLHTWAGLLIGWLLFVIFVGGTLACFDQELDDWMRPALHAVTPPDRPAFDKALAYAMQAAPDAHAWYVEAGNARSRAMQTTLYFDDESHETIAMDPVTGEPVADTAGGTFFFTLHYNLHAGDIGMYLVGLAGMFMLVALLTGVIIHKRIFKDFFTFRPGAASHRAWLDGHNVSGVLGLPFYFLMAYSGLAIFMLQYMPAGVVTAYDGDVLKAFEEAADFYERPETGKPRLRLHSADSLLADAERRLGEPVTWVSVHHTDDSSATLAFGGDHRKHIAWNIRQVFYDAQDGRFLHQAEPPSTAYKAYSLIGGLHMAQFGGNTVRWLYFLLGIAGCVMLASGMQAWVRKRAARIGAAPFVSGYSLVSVLNAGVVAGMPLAIAAMLLSNRLLPMDMVQRAQAEIAVFCMVWAAALLWAAIRWRRRSAWRDLFIATAAVLFVIPPTNFLITENSHLPASLANGNTALAVIDIALLAAGAAFALMARRCHQRMTGEMP